MWPALGAETGRDRRDGRDGGGEIKTGEERGKLCTAGSVTGAVAGLLLQNSSTGKWSATMSLPLVSDSTLQCAPHDGMFAHPAKKY